MQLNNLQEEYLYIALLLVLALLLTFVIVRNLLRYQHELKQGVLKKQLLSERGKHVFPMQINAYERMITYLERIKPTSLLYRNNARSMSAQELQFKMLGDIREELQHNLSVQMYVSSQAWIAVLAAEKEAKEIVKVAAQRAGGEASTQGYSAELFKIDEQLKQTAAAKAIEILKAEMKSYLQG